MTYRPSNSALLWRQTYKSLFVLGRTQEKKRWLVLVKHGSLHRTWWEPEWILLTGLHCLLQMALSDGGKGMTGLPLSRSGIWQCQTRSFPASFLCAGKLTCFTGQSRTLVFSGAGICNEEGLRWSVAFYSYLPKGIIGRGSSKTFLPPVLLQDSPGQESPWSFQNTGPASPSLCWCWRLSPLWSSSAMVQAPGRGVTLSLQLQHGANHSWFPVQGCLSQAGCSWPLFLLAGWHCCFCLRNANRLSCSWGSARKSPQIATGNQNARSRHALDMSPSSTRRKIKCWTMKITSCCG